MPTNKREGADSPGWSHADFARAHVGYSILATALLFDYQFVWLSIPGFFLWRLFGGRRVVELLSARRIDVVFWFALVLGAAILIAVPFTNETFRNASWGWILALFALAGTGFSAFQYRQLGTDSAK